MSTTVSTTMSLAGATTPTVILGVFEQALGQLEEEVRRQSLVPVWDRFEITTDEDFVDDPTIASPHVASYRYSTLSVLAVSRDEIDL